MFDRVLSTLWMTHQDLTDCANVCYCENQVLLSFYQQFQVKAKLKQLRTLFFRHSLTVIFDTKLKRFYSGFFELEMLQSIAQYFETF